MTIMAKIHIRGEFPLAFLMDGYDICYDVYNQTYCLKIKERFLKAGSCAEPIYSGYTRWLDKLDKEGKL